MSVAPLPLINVIDPRPAHPDDLGKTGVTFANANRRLWLLVVLGGVALGGLPAIYAAFRASWPEALGWGFQYVDPWWGGIGIAVTMLATVTMSMALRVARRGETFNLMLFLTLTITCGVCLVGVKVIECVQKVGERSLWAYDPAPAPAPPPTRTMAAASEAAEQSDPAAGTRFYRMVCAACHGAAGEGVPGLGLPLHDSPLVKQSSPKALADFVKAGRPANDPANRMKVAMPPRGGAGFLSDPDVDAIVAHLQSLSGGTPSTAASPPLSSDAGTAVSGETSPTVEDLPRWFQPTPSEGPKGIRPDVLRNYTQSLAEPSDGSRPRDAASFFSFFLGLNVLHGLQLLIGVGILAWLFMHAALGNLGPGCAAPIELGGFYWHLTNAAWLLTFVPLYLGM